MSSSTHDAETRYLQLRSSNWFIVLTILPVIPRELEYRIGVPVENPLFGYYADRSSSRRTPLLLGFFSNAAATALLYVAPNVWLLSLSRFLQGLSAAVVYTVGFALLADTVGTKDIGQWMGYVISSLNVGMLIAPTIGGIMYARCDYASLFAVMFVLIAVDILLLLVMVEKKVAARTTRGRSVLSTHAYGTFHEGTDGSNCQQQESLESSNNSSPTDSLLPGNENPSSPRVNVDHPLPLVTLLSSPRIWTDLYGVWVTEFLLASFDAALPIFEEREFGWDSMGGGLVFLTITFPIFVAPLAGWLADSWPSRWLTALWFLLSALFIVLLALISHGILEQKVLLCVLLSLYGNAAVSTILNPLTCRIGFARVFGSSPLGADLSRAVVSMERDTPGIFGHSGANGQVFALYTSATAAGVLAGPAWTSFAFGERSWVFLVSSLGILTATVIVPVSLGLDRDCVQILFTPSAKTAEPPVLMESDVEGVEQNIELPVRNQFKPEDFEKKCVFWIGNCQ
ncbi:hypothetical protein CJF30_00008403 [Rutstroemia sp. NJR-2017a BBW]|nr:hypothetical protein CJF30_00008403 [Rutstroemia sp. NJR-2017a BBW]